LIQANKRQRRLYFEAIDCRYCFQGTTVRSSSQRESFQYESMRFSPLKLKKTKNLKFYQKSWILLGPTRLLCSLFVRSLHFLWKIRLLQWILSKILACLYHPEQIKEWRDQISSAFMIFRSFLLNWGSKESELKQKGWFCVHMSLKIEILIVFPWKFDYLFEKAVLMWCRSKALKISSIGENSIFNSYQDFLWTSKLSS